MSLLRGLTTFRYNPERAFGNATMLFSGLFATALLAVHLLEPEMNQGPVSFYSLGSYGFIMRFGFLVFGLAFFSLVLGLRYLQGITNVRYVVTALLSIAGTGLVLIGLFNADPLGNSPTTQGVVHSWSANVWSIGASVGALSFAPAFRQGDKPLTVARKSRNLGMAALAVWAAGFFVYGTYLAPIQPRLFFMLEAAWVILIGSRLREGKLATVNGD